MTVRGGGPPPRAPWPPAAAGPAHGGERAARFERRLRPAPGRAPVTAGDARGPSCLLARSVELLRFIAGTRHAEGVQQAVADVVGVRHARYRGDDPAQD